MCMYRKEQHICGLALSSVSGIFWGSWNVSPTGRGGTPVKGFFREENYITEVAQNCWLLLT